MMRVNKTMSATVTILGAVLMTVVGCANDPAETQVKSTSYTTTAAPAATWGTIESVSNIGSAANE